MSKKVLKKKLQRFIAGHGHCDNRFNGMRCQHCPIATSCTDQLSMDEKIVAEAAAKRYKAAAQKYAEVFGEGEAVSLLI